MFDVDWNEIRDWSQVVFSLALVVATVVLAKATIRYQRATETLAETSKQQAAASDTQTLAIDRQTKALEQQASASTALAEASLHRPYVYLTLDWRWDGIVLRNTGDRVAHDVRMEVIEDYHKADGYLSKSRLATETIGSLAPGDEMRESRGNTRIRGAGRDEPPVTVEVSYRDADGRGYAERRTMYLQNQGEWVGGSPPIGMSNEERDTWERHGKTLEALEKLRLAVHEVAEELRWKNGDGLYSR